MPTVEAPRRCVAFLSYFTTQNLEKDPRRV